MGRRSRKKLIEVLRYQLTFGPQEQKIAAAAEEAGIDLPGTIGDKPEVREDLVLYWEAYLDLNGCRQIGFGAGPIPWTAIDTYARRHGIRDPEEFTTLKELVTAIDRDYLKFLDEDRERNKKHG